MQRATVPGTAQAILALIGVALLAPTLAMKPKSTERLEQFRDRVPTTWPTAAPFASDPAGCSAQVDRWLADGAFLILDDVASIIVAGALVISFRGDRSIQQRPATTTDHVAFGASIWTVQRPATRPTAPHRLDRA